MTARAERFVSRDRPVLLVSDFASAEVTSVISRRVRTCELTSTEANNISRRFDEWKQARAHHIEMKAADVAAAEAFLRQMNITLLAPDALLIAIAQRTGASLVTFDSKMAASAQTLGLGIADV
jgi:predicted nucleic acid-binding protein